MTSSSKTIGPRAGAQIAVTGAAGAPVAKGAPGAPGATEAPLMIVTALMTKNVLGEERAAPSHDPGPPGITGGALCHAEEDTAGKTGKTGKTTDGEEDGGEEIGRGRATTIGTATTGTDGGATTIGTAIGDR